MDTQILIGLIVTILPVFELRGGLPIIIEYTSRHGLSVLPYFFAAVILNILIVLAIFAFLDFIHGMLLKWNWYKVKSELFLAKLQKKISKVKSGMDKWGYLALTFFVAIPLPGTGAWTGALIAWALMLNKTKSFIAIAAGVIVSGLIILSISLGVFGGLY